MAQALDPLCQAITDFLKTKELPESAVLRFQVKDLASDCALMDGVLYHIWENVRAGGHIPRIIVPESLRPQLLHAYHKSPISGGHWGLNKTYEKIRLSYFWPGMRADLNKYIAACSTCNESKGTQTKVNELGEFRDDGLYEPGDHWHMDFTEMPGGESLWLAVDRASRFVVGHATTNQTADTAGKAILHEIMLHFGSPRNITSDNGQAFVGHTVAWINAALGSVHENTTPYHPQSNGLVERANETFEGVAKCLVGQSSWKRLVPFILWIINTTPNASTGVSPYFLMFGRHPRQPIDISILPDSTGVKAASLRNEFALDFHRAREAVNKSAAIARERQKLTYDAARPQSALSQPTSTTRVGNKGAHP
jgi:hypothetical protein